MTDDLKQRLRDDTRCLVSDIAEAADRIEQLEGERDELKAALKEIATTIASEHESVIQIIHQCLRIACEALAKGEKNV